MSELLLGSRLSFWSRERLFGAGLAFSFFGLGLVRGSLRKVLVGFYVISFLLSVLSVFLFFDSLKIDR